MNLPCHFPTTKSPHINPRGSIDFDTPAKVLVTAHVYRVEERPRSLDPGFHVPALCPLSIGEPFKWHLFQAVAVITAAMAALRAAQRPDAQIAALEARGVGSSRQPEVWAWRIGMFGMFTG